MENDYLTRKAHLDDVKALRGLAIGQIGRAGEVVVLP